jgi:chaperonin GroEL
MSAKEVKRGKELREIAAKAINIVAGAVKVTLGPGGRLVLIEQPYGSPKMTKDGVSVAKAIELADPLENAVASFFRSAATHTVDEAGDGTTTAIVLAEAIFNKALPAVMAGADPVKIKKGIEEAVAMVIHSLSQLKEEIVGNYEKIKQAATVSANGDEFIGDLITKAFEKVGFDGVITVEEGKSTHTELKTSEGMQFDRGYLSPYFATNTEKMIAELDNPYILIYDKKITSAQSIVPILKSAHQEGRSLLIIAEDIEGEAISTMVVNKIRGVLQVVAVKAPGFGDRRKEICQDIAHLTGATMISEEIGHKLENVTVAELGTARKVIISATETTIIEGEGSKHAISERVMQIKSQIKDATSDYDKEKLQERLAKMTSGVAILKVGASTEAEAKELKDRVDDAVQAIKAAVEEGIVPGGGVAFLHARKSLSKKLESMAISDERIGAEVLFKALEAPLRQIMENAGRQDFAVILNQIEQAQGTGKHFGLDIRNNQFGDMIAMGVIDPAKVSRCALQNAASIASMLLVSECSIVSIPKEEGSPVPGGMGGMGMGY